VFSEDSNSGWSGSQSGDVGHGSCVSMLITRWDGRRMKTWAVQTIAMCPKLGATAIVPGQSVGIYLYSDRKGL